MARVYRRNIGGKPYRNWTIELRDHLGTVRRFTGYHDKRASDELAAKLERLVAYRAARRTLDGDLTQWLEGISPTLMTRLAGIGLVDGQTQAGAKPLAVVSKIKMKQFRGDLIVVNAGHLLDYQNHLQNRELNPRYIRQAVAHIVKLIQSQRMTFAHDITPERIEAHVTGLRQSGASARTVNSALTDIGTFCRWMRKHGRIASDPTARVNVRMNEKADRRVIRRALTIDEIRRLIGATEAGDVHHGLTGRERGLVYQLALETGLRHNEIKTLTRADFLLSASPASVRIQAQNEKAGRGDVLPIRPELAQALAGYFNETLSLPNALAFPTMWKQRGAEMLREDLDAAGVDWRPDASGASVDFHSLRHTFATMLANSGIHPRVAQDLLRHSDINLTMKTYSHTLIDDRAKATSSLPSFMPENQEAKTGTMDADEMAENSQADLQAVLRAVEWQKKAIFGTTSGNENGSAGNGADNEKARKTQGFTGVVSWLPPRDSNPDKQNQNLKPNSSKPSKSKNLQDSKKPQAALQAVVESVTKSVQASTDGAANPPADGDLAGLIKSILELPLSAQEKAECVRRLLAR